MKNVKPEELTAQQWLLLQHLNLYSIPFCIQSLCKAFNKSQVDRPLFYRMFFGLVIRGYVLPDKTLPTASNYLQNFCYTITPKGRMLVNNYTQEALSNNKATSTNRKYAINGIIEAIRPETIILKNYVFCC